MSSFFGDIFGGAAQKDAATQDRIALQQYQGQALPALQSAYQTGTTALDKAVGAYTPLAQLGQTYSAGAPTLMGALGVGTPDQVAAAQAAFKPSPGYQFTLDQQLQAAQRAAAAGGMSRSGNAMIDAMNRAQGLSNTEYQQWVNNLLNTGQLGTQATGAAAGGQAAGYGAQANLAQNYGQSQANVFGNVASGNINANQLAAQGEAQGAQNILGAGMSLLTLGLGGNPLGGGSLAPKGGSWNFANTPLGSLSSSFGNMFGSSG